MRDISKECIIFIFVNSRWKQQLRASFKHNISLYHPDSLKIIIVIINKSNIWHGVWYSLQLIELKIEIVLNYCEAIFWL